MGKVLKKLQKQRSIRRLRRAKQLSVPKVTKQVNASYIFLKKVYPNAVMLFNNKTLLLSDTQALHRVSILFRDRLLTVFGFYFYKLLFDLEWYLLNRQHYIQQNKTTLNMLKYNSKRGIVHSNIDFNLRSYGLYETKLPRYIFYKTIRLFNIISGSFNRFSCIGFTRLNLIRNSISYFLINLTYMSTIHHIKLKRLITEFNTTHTIYSGIGCGSKKSIGIKTNKLLNRIPKKLLNKRRYKQQNHFTLRYMKYVLFDTKRYIFILYKVLRIKQQIYLRTKLANQNEPVFFQPHTFKNTSNFWIKMQDILTDANFNGISFIRTLRLRNLNNSLYLPKQYLNDFLFIDTDILTTRIKSITGLLNFINDRLHNELGKRFNFSFGEISLIYFWNNYITRCELIEHDVAFNINSFYNDEFVLLIRSILVNLIYVQSCKLNFNKFVIIYYI